MSAFSQSSLRGKSRVQIIAIGLPKEVLQLMYRLHRCGLEMPLWSPPQPIPDTEEVDTEEVVHVYIQNAGQNSRGTIQNLRPIFHHKNVGQGTELGLSISYQIIVDKHDGSISFKTEGENTTFIILLRL